MGQYNETKPKFESGALPRCAALLNELHLARERRAVKLLCQQQQGEASGVGTAALTAAQFRLSYCLVREQRAGRTAALRWRGTYLLAEEYVLRGDNGGIDGGAGCVMGTVKITLDYEMANLEEEDRCSSHFYISWECNLRLDDLSTFTPRFLFLPCPPPPSNSPTQQLFLSLSALAPPCTPACSPPSPNRPQCDGFVLLLRGVRRRDSCLSRGRGPTPSDTAVER
ncbi:hypothetical protein EYF80_025335 [Liparis tanakae]|uniref:Uncharacterized protein n=1 Tax=Liparis tanakae TaxID=230148 RepID=A0A4Z2HHV0_9TELE|nr:hypothetical protein EYF80_025335 [Liparis tanakae]